MKIEVRTEITQKGMIIIIINRKQNYEICIEDEQEGMIIKRE